MARLRCFPLVLMLVLGAPSVPAPEQPISLDDLSRSVQQWMQNNLDDRILQALQKVDQDQVRLLFGELNRRLQGTNVYELRPLKDAATRLLPVLREHEAARPYASWLESHLDYLEAADQLWRQMQRPPPKTGVPPSPAPPTPQAQRSVWDKQLETRPLPPRARKYVPQLQPVFTAAGIPPALVWLAEVESSFDPEARSPAGAVGLFQLMPATARGLGLALSPEDERRIAEKNARAASRYLRELHGRFGDWALALAAYNAGPTRVSRLLAQSGSGSFQAIAPQLPAETQLYVPKVDATLRKRAGVGLADLKK